MATLTISIVKNIIALRREQYKNGNSRLADTIRQFNLGTDVCQIRKGVDYYIWIKGHKSEVAISKKGDVKKKEGDKWVPYNI